MLVYFSVDPIMLGACQGSHWSANFEVTGMTRPGKIPSQAGFEQGWGVRGRIALLKNRNPKLSSNQDGFWYSRHNRDSSFHSP